MRIAVLLSGGVDSSVALQVLRTEGGHDLAAFYLKVWLEDELDSLGACPWEEDLRFARQVCRELDVPLEVVSMQREYRERIVAHTIDELRAGRTPSPDVLCNRRIKFGAFVDRLPRAYGRIASGHYARLERSDDRVSLALATDRRKDQTYFLSQLRQEQLARCLFPIGHLEKAEVRARAAAAGLPTSDRPDSQGICFLGRIRFDHFVRAHLGEDSGEIREAESGRLLGEHRGHWFFTIGQRRGLGLGGGPWYVVDKDVEQNLITVCHLETHALRSRRCFTIPRPSWIDGPPSRRRLTTKIRHGEHLLPCHVDRRAAGGLEVRLEVADRGIAPGQYAAIYEDDVCRGGGEIRI